MKLSQPAVAFLLANFCSFVVAGPTPHGGSALANRSPANGVEYAKRYEGDDDEEYKKMKRYAGDDDEEYKKAKRYAGDDDEQYKKAKRYAGDDDEEY